MKIIYQSKNTNLEEKRWCVYSHYDPFGRAQPYVIDALREISKSGLMICFVTTSLMLDRDSIKSLEKYVTILLIRKNVGYDFGSYKVGILHLIKNKLDPIQLVITNDSVYGPMNSSLENILKKAERFDIYGLTDSVEIEYHLQSYFLVYGRKVINSKTFLEFWNKVELLNVNDFESKMKLIRKYEVGGSQLFMKEKFSIGVEFNYKDLFYSYFNKYISQFENAVKVPGFKFKPIDIQYNPSHYFWRELIEAGYPYFKKELLLVNPLKLNIQEWPTVIQNGLPYDLTNIVESIYDYSGSYNFMYTTQGSEIISNAMDENGKVSLCVNPAFVDLANELDIPKCKEFLFDRYFYLKNNEYILYDVTHIYSSNPVEHFKSIGFKMDLKIRLTPISDRL